MTNMRNSSIDFPRIVLWFSNKGVSPGAKPDCGKCLTALACAGPLLQMPSLPCLLTNLSSSFKINLCAQFFWNHSGTPQVKFTSHSFKLPYDVAYITIIFTQHSMITFLYNSLFSFGWVTQQKSEPPSYASTYCSICHRKKSSITLGRSTI